MGLKRLAATEGKANRVFLVDVSVFSKLFVFLISISNQSERNIDTFFTSSL